MNYIDSDDMNELALALIEIIIEDDNITDDTIIYIDKDGKDKAYIRNIQKASLPGLIAGIMDYIAQNSPDTSKARDYVKQWFVKTGKSNEVSRALISLYEHDVNVEIEIPIDITRAEEGAFYPNQEVYFSKAKEEYGNAKTFFYNEQSRPLEDFFVCSDIAVRHIGLRSININIFKFLIDNREPNCTIAKLENLSKQTIITGTGGIGKSMMMRHLMVDAIDNKDKYRRFPIFITLRDYKKVDGEQFESMFDLLLRELNLRQSNFGRNNLEKALDDGEVVLLLDGLDEVSPELLDGFSKEINDFASRYSNNQFIMSSRQMSEFGEYSRFRIVDLCPLTKEQAISLVNKLEYRDDEPEFKKGFIKRLDDELYSKHTDFAQIPLLLNIMLTTYAAYDNIPSKIHIFYERAFRALAEQHDAGKRNGFHRPMKSGLEMSDLEKLIGEFCYLTYKENKYEFKRSELYSFIDSMKEKDKLVDRLSPDDFLYDIELCLCMLYHEGDVYSFSHRSFQEYFTALYISDKGETRFRKLGEEYDQNKHGGGDMMFRMLYDMKTERVKEGMILPALERVFKCDDDENGYHRFLRNAYKYIVVSDTDMDRVRGLQLGGNCGNVYNVCFLMVIKEFEYDDIIDMYYPYIVVPYYEEFVSNTYYIADNDLPFDEIHSESAIIERAGSDNVDDILEEYTQIGCEMKIPTKKIFDEPDKYHDIIDVFEDDKCVLRREYKIMKGYYDSLVSEIEEW